MSESKYSEKYTNNLTLFNDCVSLQNNKKPPFITTSMHFFPAKFAGVSKAAVMTDPRLHFDCLKRVLFHYKFTMAPSSGLGWGSFPWEILGSKQWRKPGSDLLDDMPFQFIEQENMKADEYPIFLSDPSDFILRKLYPRISSKLEVLNQISPVKWHISSPEHDMSLFCDEKFVEMVKSLLELGEKWKEYIAYYNEYHSSITEAGYPEVFHSYGLPPFDQLSVSLRGLQGSMLDLIRKPDYVIKTVEFLADQQIDLLINVLRGIEHPRVVFFAYRGTDAFMSEEQFRKFYWPSLRRVLISLVDAGITPIPYFEGDFTSRLHYLLDLPKGKVPTHFEKVDRKKAREVIGDYNAFWGNIPASLLTLGNREEVKADVNDLINIFGDTNGLIIDGSVEVPDESKPENIDAVFESIAEYY